MWAAGTRQRNGRSVDAASRIGGSCKRHSADQPDGFDRQHFQYAGGSPRGQYYLGITIAEYYRDMGYDVLMLADSTHVGVRRCGSIGTPGRDPGEEGYPAYLSSRLAEFYERQAMWIALGTGERSSMPAPRRLCFFGRRGFPTRGDFSDPSPRVHAHCRGFLGAGL